MCEILGEYINKINKTTKMIHTKNMTKYVEDKGLNIDLIELTLLAIFAINDEAQRKVDKVKDFILLTESRKGVKVNKFVKLHVFEAVYLKTALTEIKKLNKCKNLN